MFLFLVVVLCIFFSYFYLQWVKLTSYWKEREVPHVPGIPVFGSMLDVILKRKSMGDFLAEIYNTHKNERYCGLYQFHMPTLMIRDPELIKLITLRDFEKFTNRRSFVDDKTDPYVASSLAGAKGKTLVENILSDSRWHDLRVTLSPTFTSGKTKAMFHLIKEGAEQFADYFDSSGEDFFEVEAKDVFGKFTADLIASITLGVKVESLKCGDNEFYRKIKDGLSAAGRAMILYAIFPSLSKLLKYPVFKPSMIKILNDLIQKSLEQRRLEGVIRPDMLHLLKEAQMGRLDDDEEVKAEENFAAVNESNLVVKRRKIHLTDVDITAQVALFFVGGYDTNSNIISYLSYELAMNEDVQKRLLEEVDEAWKNSRGNITYEKLLEMKYLDMVVSECLRKWPPALIVDRIAKETYKIKSEKPGEKELILEPGSIVCIPIYALHNDSRYYPNPEVFDPERFNEENKININPNTYIPFGSGPRSCIASRFALLTIKLLIVCLLRRFTIIPVGKTRNSHEKRSKYHLADAAGFFVGFQKRNH